MLLSNWAAEGPVKATPAAASSCPKELCSLLESLRTELHGASALLAKHGADSTLGQQHVRILAAGQCGLLWPATSVGKWVGWAAGWPQIKRIVARHLATFVATLTSWESISIISRAGSGNE